MGMDFPRGWEVARAAPMADHDPKCSYRQHDGGFLCDCLVLTEHPEYRSDVLYTRGGIP
jgi:hypothetical protein